MRARMEAAQAHPPPEVPAVKLVPPLRTEGATPVELPAGKMETTR